MSVASTPPLPVVDVTRRPFNARGDGVTDCTVSIQAAIDAAAAAGGGIVFLPEGTYAISDPVDVGALVSLRGTGMRASVLLATTADAALTSSAFEHTTWEDIGFDGNDLSTVGIEVHVGANAGGMRNVRVWDCVGTNGAMRLHNVQNATFDNIELSSSTSGLWVDDGCGSLVFTALKANNNEYWQVKIGSSGAEASGYTEPSSITFIAPVMEWNGENATARTRATCLITGGEYLTMIAPIFSAPNAGQTEPALAMETVAPSIVCRLQIVGGIAIGGATDAMVTLGANAFLHFVGQFRILGGTTAFALTSASARLEGDIPTLNSTMARTFSGGASEGNCVIQQTSGQDFHIAQAAGDRLFLGMVNGESGIRHVRYSDGKLGWHGGTAYVEDTNLYRGGANLLKTDDTFVATGGIGVGNSAAATTPGAVSKKCELFDENGTSLGYLAVYHTIT